MKLMKQFQADIEHSSHKGQAGFNVKLKPKMNLLGFANDSQHRERGFNAHAVIPLALLAQFDILRNAVSAAEAPVGEHNFVPIAQIVQKGGIRHVHFVPDPAADLSEGIEYPSHINAHTHLALIAPLVPAI